MTDKVQKIREEVVRLRNLHQIKYQQIDTNDNMCLVECGKRNLCNELLSFIDSLQEEPVSEDLEKASKEWLTPKLDKSYAVYGEAKMMELTKFDGYAILDAIEFGAKWQKVKHERQFSFINLKDCKDAYNEWKGTQKEPVSAALSWVRACQWQKAKDQETIELAEDHAYFAGRTKTIDEIKESLLSEVLPCFMHGGEADEVVAKLDEVLNQKK